MHARHAKINSPAKRRKIASLLFVVPRPPARDVNIRSEKKSLSRSLANNSQLGAIRGAKSYLCPGAPEGFILRGRFMPPIRLSLSLLFLSLSLSPPLPSTHPPSLRQILHQRSIVFIDLLLPSNDSPLNSNRINYPHPARTDFPRRMRRAWKCKMREVGGCCNGKDERLSSFLFLDLVRLGGG